MHNLQKRNIEARWLKEANAPCAFQPTVERFLPPAAAEFTRTAAREALMVAPLPLMWTRRGVELHVVTEPHRLEPGRTRVLLRLL